MPEKRTVEKAKKKLREGKSPTTAAGEFVHEEIKHVREGKHGARSPEQAIAILERLSRLPSWVSPAELRADPIWDPLRGHPRFQRLAAGGAGAPVT